MWALTEQERRLVWQMRARGMTMRAIAREFACAHSTIEVSLKTPGPREVGDSDWKGGGRRLCLLEREEISRGLRSGESLGAIARRLERSTSTVSREVERNGGRDHYRAVIAHRAARARCRRPKARKLEDPELSAQVFSWLHKFWSPEEIARRLRIDYPDEPRMWVSHETIYKSLFVQGRGELRRELTRCLRSGRYDRRPRDRSERRGKIADMVMISERPAEAEDRAVPGHWEGDLLMGKDGRSAVGTLVERSTRYLILLHLPEGRSATEVREAMAAAIQRLPEHLWHSITWDQGKEMSEHARFSVDTGVPVYFCDPHSPWMRGSNENTNGLLRQYMPKGTDLSLLSAEDLDHIAYSLNDRPRATLGFMKPSEKLAELLASTD